MSLFSRLSHTRTYHYYDTETFCETYRGGLSHDGPSSAVLARWQDAVINGEALFLVYDDEMDWIMRRRDELAEFDRRLSEAVGNNNDGIALEKAGDIDGAVMKYEQNIMPGAYFTLHPYHRLCVIYRGRKDHDNEIRVIETCLSRPEWDKAQYAGSNERQFFEDRLEKTIQIRNKQTK